MNDNDVIEKAARALFAWDNPHDHLTWENTTPEHRATLLDGARDLADKGLLATRPVTREAIRTELGYHIRTAIALHRAHLAHLARRREAVDAQIDHATDAVLTLLHRAPERGGWDMEGLAVALFEGSHEEPFTDDERGMAEAREWATSLIAEYGPEDDRAPERDVEAEARAEAEREWPPLSSEEGLATTYPRDALRASARTAFVAGALWATGGAR